MYQTQDKKLYEVFWIPNMRKKYLRVNSTLPADWSELQVTTTCGTNCLFSYENIQDLKSLDTQHPINTNQRFQLNQHNIMATLFQLYQNKPEAVTI